MTCLASLVYLSENSARCCVRYISYVKLYVFRCRIRHTIHVKLSLSNISITLIVTLKLRAEMDLSIIFLWGTIPNTLIGVRKPFISLTANPPFLWTFFSATFCRFLTRVRVLGRVFGMEPSTSGENIRQKHQRKSLYDQRQVLDLLLEGGSDEELYEISSNKGNINPIQSAFLFCQISLKIISSDLCNSQSTIKTLSRKG